MENNKTNNNSWLPLIISIGGLILIAHLISKLVSYLINSETSDIEESSDKKISNKKKREKKPRIFVSHSWEHNNDYNKLINGFEKQGFQYYNNSISIEKNDDSKNSKEIETRIKNHLLYARCLLVLAGEYSNNYWIKKEVEIAKSLGKKIIAVKPWQSKQIPKYIENSADEIIGFNPKAIIEQIK
ncbi:MTH538 TIR-like domain [Lutibacter oricola]|uniref:MTH538 TIR-like domain n=1 Tax=Lutibacter oricola TaxID=762486 RepID=A0A1H3E7N5_9FLAO|nr:TIR domain-containing protein [Lutibacter oricola]SDX74716.1 MTH538 TIR-like domain [Lutibacter oricola]